MTTYSRLLAAARREHWATRLWWAAMALLSAAALAILLQLVGIRTEFILCGLLLWGTAWLAPWTAMASLRRRPTAPPPASASDDLPAWRTYASALASRLDWAIHVLADHQARAVVATAHADFVKLIRSHPSARDLEAACARISTETFPELRRALWCQLIPEIMPIAATAYERARAAANPVIARRHRIEAVRDAAAVALCRLHPQLLMADLLRGADECTLSALTYASPQQPLVPLAAALAIDWGNPALPWHPIDARAAALDLVASVDPYASLKFPSPATTLGDLDQPVAPNADAMPLVAAPVPPPATAPTPTPAPEPSASPAPAAPSSSAAPSPASRHHHHHHHHHHRHRHRHHRSSLPLFLSPFRDITRILGSFFQRLHYLIKSAWLYR